MNQSRLGRKHIARTQASNQRLTTDSRPLPFLRNRGTKPRNQTLTNIQYAVQCSSNRTSTTERAGIDYHSHIASGCGALCDTVDPRSHHRRRRHPSRLGLNWPPPSRTLIKTRQIQQVKVRNDTETVPTPAKIVIPVLSATDTQELPPLDIDALPGLKARVLETQKRGDTDSDSSTESRA